MKANTTQDKCVSVGPSIAHQKYFGRFPGLTNARKMHLIDIKTKTLYFLRTSWKSKLQQGL